MVQCGLKFGKWGVIGSPVLLVLLDKIRAKEYDEEILP